MNMKTNLKLTSAVALVITSCAITSVTGATFNVRELGAKGDGRTFDTDAIAEGSATSIAASPPQKSPAGFSSLGSFMSCGNRKGITTV